MLKKIGAFLRWRDWGPGKLPVMFSLLIYVGLSGNRLSARFALQCFFLILAAAVHCAFGYLVNEWGDRNTDQIQGKRNVFQNAPPLSAKVMLTGLLILACISLIPFFHIAMVVPLWVCWVFLAWAYSLRPIRLKERGLWSLLASTAAQWTLPVLLAFAVFEQFRGWDMVALTVAFSISGGTLEIGHQRHDRKRDRITLSDTLGARMQPSALDTLYRIALTLDKIAVGIVLLVISTGLRHRFAWSGVLGPLWPVLVFYGGVLVFAVIENIRKRSEKGFMDPYYSGDHSANRLLHETIPNFIIPTCLLALSASIEHSIAWLLCFFLFWRIVLGVADWKWPIRTLRTQINKYLSLPK